MESMWASRLEMGMHMVSKEADRVLYTVTGGWRNIYLTLYPPFLTGVRKDVVLLQIADIAPKGPGYRS